MKRVKNPEIGLIATIIITVLPVFMGNVPPVLRWIFGGITAFLLFVVLLIVVPRVSKTLAFRRQVRESKTVLLNFYKGQNFTIQDKDAFLPGATKRENGITIRFFSAGKDDDLQEVLLEFKYKNTLDYARFTIVWNLEIDTGKQKAIQVADFPDEIACHARPGHACYLVLNAATRKNIRALTGLTDAFSISESIMDIRPSFKTTAYPERLLSLVDCCRSIAERITEPWKLHLRLEETALRDPVPAFRCHVLAGIGKLYEKTDSEAEQRQVHDVLVRALQDPELVNQLEAAGWLGDEGLAHIGELINERKTLDYLVWYQAVRVVIRMVRHTWTQPEKLRRRLRLLQVLFGQQEDVAMRIEILDVFRKAASEEYSPWLGEWLVVENRAVLLALIQALQTCGDLQTVEPLYKLGKSSRNRKIDEAVGTAIAAIQERHGTGDGGWLTVAETAEEAGALSLDQRAGQGGELSGK